MGPDLKSLPRALLPQSKRAKALHCTDEATIDPSRKMLLQNLLPDNKRGERRISQCIDERRERANCQHIDIIIGGGWLQVGPASPDFYSHKLTNRTFFYFFDVPSRNFTQQPWVANAHFGLCKYESRSMRKSEKHKNKGNSSQLTYTKTIWYSGKPAWQMWEGSVCNVLPIRPLKSIFHATLTAQADPDLQGFVIWLLVSKKVQNWIKGVWWIQFQQSTSLTVTKILTGLPGQSLLHSLANQITFSFKFQPISTTLALTIGDWKLSWEPVKNISNAQVSIQLACSTVPCLNLLNKEHALVHAHIRDLLYTIALLQLDTAI